MGTERYLHQFTTQLDAAGVTVITLQQVLAFVCAPELAEGSVVPQHRLMAVRGFTRYLAAIDPRTEVPPAGLVTYRAAAGSPTCSPTTRSAAVVRLRAGQAPFVFRAETLATMIVLLAVTGMRVGEALRLDCCDVDWDRPSSRSATAQVRQGSDVLVSASTIEALPPT